MKLCIHSELLIKWNFSSSCMYQIMVKKWYSNYYELVLIQNLHLISMFPVVMHSMKFYSSNSITLSEEHGHICMKWLVWLSSLLRVFSTPVNLSMQFILIKQFTLYSIHSNHSCCLQNVIQLNKICKNIIKFVGLNFCILLI